MQGLRNKRELAELSQIALASRAEVSRMRLQLAEAGVLTLRPDEIDAIGRVLRDSLQRRAAALQSALLNTFEQAKG